MQIGPHSDADCSVFGKIAHWAGTDIDALGKAPASTARVVADAVDGQPPEDQASVKKLAEALVAALKIEAQKSGGPFGLIIKKLEARRFSSAGLPSPRE